MTSDSVFARLRPRFGVPDAPFIEDEDGRRLTYGRLVGLSGRLAAMLVTHGVRPGDRVAVLVEKCPMAIVLYLACARAGAVFVPLNPAYTDDEVGYILADAEPRLVVGAPARLPALSLLAGAEATVLTLAANGAGTLMEAADGATPLLDDVPRIADDLAAIVYTSGTTGRPKGAMLTHGNLVSNAEVLGRAWRFTGDDWLIHALPVFHTHGLFVATNIVLWAGAAMHFRPRFDAAEVLRLMPRATVLMGVPTFYTRLLADPDLTPAKTRSMRVFISGSAPLSADTHRAFAERTGHAILERYGLTETNMNTSNPYDGERRPGTVGRPLPGVALRVVDRETGRPLPAGEVGMVEVRGANVCAGYWRDPAKTAAAFRDDGFFITGDLGRVDDDGYLTLVGRVSDLVISGGFNVYPAEVEAAIAPLPGIAECAVIGLPDDDLGERVVAVLVADDATGIAPPSDAAALKALLAGRLAGYKIPRQVIRLPALPRNAMGKVEKAALRARFGSALSSAPGLGA